MSREKARIKVAVVAINCCLITLNLYESEKENYWLIYGS